MQRKLHFRLLAPAAAVALATLAGCTEYLDRRDTIALWAGDAQQANLVTHAVHPSPAHASQRQLWFDGERMQRAHQRYRTNTVIPPATNMGAGGAMGAAAGAGARAAGG